MADNKKKKADDNVEAAAPEGQDSQIREMAQAFAKELVGQLIGGQQSSAGQGKRRIQNIRRGQRYGMGSKGDESTASGFVKFVSDKRELTLFMNETELLKFSSHNFITNDKEEIAFLRSHPALNHAYWEGKLPNHIVDKFKKERELLTYSEDDFITGE